MMVLPLLEALAGDRVHMMTVREVAEAIGGDTGRVLSTAVEDTSQTLAEALENDRGYALFCRRAPRQQRRELERNLLKWAKRAGRPAGGTRALPPGPLKTFVDEHGLEARLDEPIEVLQHLVGYHEYYHARRHGGTLREVALRSRESWPAVRAYLEYCVQRRATMAAREARWSVPAASPALSAASERLRRRYAALAVREPPPPARMVDVMERLDDEEVELRLVDRHTYPPAEVAVSFLRSDEDGGALVRTRLLREHPLIRVALERALDVLHDRDDPLHGEVRHAIEAPRWERLLLKLHEVVRPLEASPRAEQRVIYRLDAAPKGRVGVDPYVQKRTARGGFTKGRRVDIEQLRRSGATLDEHDERVLAAAAPRPFDAGSHTTGSRDGEILEALVGHPRVRIGDAPARVLIRAPELIVEESDGQLELSLRVGERVYSPADVRDHLVRSTFAALDRERAEVEVARIDPALTALLSTFVHYATHVPVGAADQLVAVLTRLPSHVGLELPASIAGQATTADPRPVVRAEPLPGGALRAQIFVRPLGGGPLHRPGEGPTHLVATVDGARLHTKRDLAAERHAVDALLVAGLDAGVAESRHVVRFDAPDEALAFLEALAERPELAALEWPDDEPGWRVTSPTRFDLGLRRAEHWFEADARLDVDETQVSLAALLLALREGRRYVQVGKGRFARIAGQLRAQLEALDPVVHVRGASARIAPSAAAHVDAVLDEEHVQGDRAWKSLRKRLRASSTAKPEVPEGLTATLRDYQIAGIEWLLRTASWAEGACLADEMGLGKTLQALALLLARAEAGPSLVVCPTSLSDNWVEECKRFVPEGLRPRLYRGSDRAALIETLEPGDLLIASYDVVARDREALAGVSFSTLVLDEAQAIKNPAALRTKAVGEISAEFRLALTGTPIENRLAELYSLFSILTPGLLGPWEAFRTRFAAPIEKQGDMARLEQLRAVVRPFLLRRTKALVARELPARTEIVRPVELGDEERALYEAQRLRALEMLNGKRKEADFRFALLAELTRLRRLVCHPRLVVEETTAPSSKIDELLALVDDLRREEHRALVFSQFTSLLAIVGRELEARRIDYLYLDGSTPAEDRATLVRQWQEGDAPLFLISLKAGGTGLNLTAADYVVHLDPWWNPAVEDQASDRAHRIGQTKPVTVVRLVAQGTIEERVLAMHEEKRRLASGILEGSETTAALAPDELLALLGDGEPAAIAPRARPARAKRAT